MTKSKTYSVDIECDNCEYNGKVFLPRGMKISDVLSKTDCPNCGCQELEKKQVRTLTIPYNPLPNPPTNPIYPQPWDTPFYRLDRVTCDDSNKLMRQPNLISQMLVN